MKKVLAAIVTFIFSVCLISATVATASAASVKKVSNFKASATPIAVTLTWKKSSDAKGYEIQQKSGKKWKTVATIKKAKTTSYTVKKLKNGTTYQFRIRAVNGKKKGAYVSLKIKTGVEKIKSVKATSTGLKSVKLTWEKANVTGYEIQRKVGKKWKAVKKIKKAKTTYLNVSKLPAGQKATFRIRGYYNGSAKTYYGSYTTVNVTTAVAPMKNASVKSVTDTSATIGWAKLSGVSGYQIQKLQSGKWVDVNKAVKSSVTQYTLKGLAAFTNQQIRVRAYQKDGKKTYYNNWVTINAKTKISNVTGLTYSGLSANAVKISWKAAAGASGYRVLNNGAKIADVKTNYANLTLKAATTYKITVVPYNGSTAGNTTSAITFTSPCAKVTGVKVTGTTETTATVTWNKTAGATGYQLQYCKDGIWSSAVSATGTSYQVKDLSANSVYSFRVRALNKNGSATQYGAYSDTPSATTKGLGSFEENTVSWHSVNGASYYEVQYYNSETFAWEVAETNITATSYTNAEICDDETKLFKVTAFDNSGKAIYTSNTASANISDVKFSISDNIVSVSWSKYANTTSYEVRIKSKGMADEGATVLKATDAKRSVTSGRLAPGLTYEVMITTVKGGKTVNLAGFTVKATDFVINETDKSKTDQLLYLVEAINRSKYDNSQTVILNSTPYSLNEIKYMDFGFQIDDDPLGVKRGAVHALLRILFADSLAGNYEIADGFIKCKDATSIDAVFASMDSNGSQEKISKQESGGHKIGYRFHNGKYYLDTANYTLADLIQPVGDNGLAFLYNSGNVSAWKKGFSKVVTTTTDSGYRIEATLKEESVPNYHDGFIDSMSSGDIGLGDMGATTINNKVGSTVIVAELDKDCYLTSYKITSPYKYDMKVELSLSGEQANLADNDDEANAALNTVLSLLEKVVIEMNVEAEGRQEYDYSFTRIK